MGDLWAGISSMCPLILFCWETTASIRPAQEGLQCGCSFCFPFPLLPSHFFFLSFLPAFHLRNIYKHLLCTSSVLGTRMQRESQHRPRRGDLGIWTWEHVAAQCEKGPSNPGERGTQREPNPSLPSKWPLDYRAIFPSRREPSGASVWHVTTSLQANHISPRGKTGPSHGTRDI